MGQTLANLSLKSRFWLSAQWRYFLIWKNLFLPLLIALFTYLLKSQYSCCCGKVWYPDRKSTPTNLHWSSSLMLNVESLCATDAYLFVSVITWLLISWLKISLKIFTLKVYLLFHLLICLISSHHLFWLLLTGSSFFFLILSLSGFVASRIFTFDSRFEVWISTVPAISTTWFSEISLRLFLSPISLLVSPFSWFGGGSSTMSTCSFYPL